MDPNSGRYVDLPADIPDDVARFTAAQHLGVDPADMIKLEGTAEAVRKLSENVRLGAQERAARQERRKRQKQARRRNR